MSNFKSLLSDPKHSELFKFGDIQTFNASFSVNIKFKNDKGELFILDKVIIGGHPNYNWSTQSLSLTPSDSEKDRQEMISSLIFSVPDLSNKTFTYSLDEFRIRVMAYRIRVLLFYCGYLLHYVPVINEYTSKFGFIDGFERAFSDISGFGFEPQLVILLSNQLMQKFQSKYQTFKGLDLSFDEISQIESDADTRRKISKKYAALILSDDYLKLSEREQESIRSENLHELDKNTSVLYKIVHMGAQYLSSSARMHAKISGGKSLDVAIELLRRSELAKFRENQDKYTLPIRDS